jgi:hypothetical protein
MKSDRLKKLEGELADLEQWLALGLVPKKDIDKHKDEIEALKKKIGEESSRIEALKESGDSDEYVAPKRSQGARQVYQEPQTLPGESDQTESGVESETEGYETESTTHTGVDEDTTTSDVEEDDPFSDRNRWKRGVLEDLDSDQW